MPLGPRLRLAKSTRLKFLVSAVPGRAAGRRGYGFTQVERCRPNLVKLGSPRVNHNDPGSSFARKGSAFTHRHTAP